MPYIRTSRGTRIQFKPTTVARRFSDVFQTLYGSKVARFRGEIQILTEEVVQSLRSNFGSDPASEWSDIQIIQAMEVALKNSEFDDAHAVFLEKYPKVKKTRASRVKIAEFEPLLHEPESDPIWAVQFDSSSLSSVAILSSDLSSEPSTTEPFITKSDNKSDTVEFLELEQLNLGRGIGRAKPKKTLSPSFKHAKRSEWIEWWRKEAQSIRKSMDLMALEEASKAMGPSLRSQTPEEWWKFWQAIFDEAMKKDPRLMYLLQSAQIRRQRAAVVGKHWLYGTTLTHTSLQDKSPLMDDADADAWYRRLWMDYIQRFDDPRLQGYPLETLARALKPERDYLLDWRGYQKLQGSESLRPLNSSLTWNSAPDWKPSPGSHEPPQWAWMRLAMVLGSLEQNPIQWVEKWYLAFSSLSIIPSESLLRQAGRRSPRLIEDMAARVTDNFEATQEAIYQSALNTKWTGTVSLDWGQVRAKGSPIAGRRVSQGVASFIKAIDTNLITQGRPSSERPVTVSIPIWHREVEAFLSETQTSQCIQTVLSISDLFMERVRNRGSWALMDPAFFPMLENPQEEHYLKAEEIIPSIQKQQPQAVRVVSAMRLWQKILKQIQKTGRPFLLFTGIQKAFEPFPEYHPVQHGIDGVGALPLPLPDAQIEFEKNSKKAGALRGKIDENYHSSMPWVMWPAAAVNLKDVVSHDGTPDVAHLRELTSLAMRMLDNAFTLSESEGRLASWASAHRSICLGAIGFQEAIERASSAALGDASIVDGWVASLAETWATAIISADQDLKKERGVAPVWRGQEGRVYNPIDSMSRFQIQRGGSLSIPFTPQTNWGEVSKRIQNSGGHRMSARTLWAPFAGAASIAAVSPGGIGANSPIENSIDETGQERWMPTPLLLQLLELHPESLHELSAVLKYPTQPQRWPEIVREKSHPDLWVWKKWLKHAALIRPWVDQGVSLTLPHDLSWVALQSLIEQAWQFGVDTVRFEDNRSESNGQLELEEGEVDETESITEHLDWDAPELRIDEKR